MKKVFKTSWNVLKVFMAVGLLLWNMMMNVVGILLCAITSN